MISVCTSHTKQRYSGVLDDEWTEIDDFRGRIPQKVGAKTLITDHFHFIFTKTLIAGFKIRGFINQSINVQQNLWFMVYQVSVIASGQ